MKIALCVGHSILKSGACTSADGRKYGGCLEYNWNKAFSRQVKSALEKKGHKVTRIICPEKQFTSSIQERNYKLDKINNGDYDLVMELHLNSGPEGANGAEVLYKSMAGKKYAEGIQRELRKVFRDRGTKQRSDLYMLNQTTPPAIIVETFFCGNKNEYKKARGLSNRTKIAKMIADGIE